MADQEVSARNIDADTDTDGDHHIYFEGARGIFLAGRAPDETCSACSNGMYCAVDILTVRLREDKRWSVVDFSGHWLTPRYDASEPAEAVYEADVQRAVASDNWYVATTTTAIPFEEGGTNGEFYCTACATEKIVWSTQFVFEKQAKNYGTETEFLLQQVFPLEVELIEDESDSNTCSFCWGH
jgi:hypothetical protein